MNRNKSRARHHRTSCNINKNEDLLLGTWFCMLIHQFYWYFSGEISLSEVNLYTILWIFIHSHSTPIIIIITWPWKMNNWFSRGAENVRNCTYLERLFVIIKNKNRCVKAQMCENEMTQNLNDRNLNLNLGGRSHMKMHVRIFS